MRHSPTPARRSRRWTSDPLPLEPRLCPANPPAYIDVASGQIDDPPIGHEMSTAVGGHAEVDLDNTANGLYVNNVTITIQNALLDSTLTGGGTGTYLNTMQGHFPRAENTTYAVPMGGVMESQVIQWYWDEHPGDRTVTVTVNYANGDSDSDTFTVHVQAPTIADFTVTPPAGGFRFGPWSDPDGETLMNWGDPNAFGIGFATTDTGCDL